MPENKQNYVNIIIGLGLVGIGGIFLIARLFNIDLMRYTWPFFVIIPGLMFFAGMMLGGKATGPLAIPGSIVTTVGVLLLYQALFSHYESWAYAWALVFPGAVGLGLIINGLWSGIDKLVRVGQNWLNLGLLMFAFGIAFWEGVLNVGGNTLANYVWPLSLIGVGLYLVLKRRRPWEQPASPRPDSTEEQVRSPNLGFEPIDTGHSRK